MRVLCIDAKNHHDSKAPCDLIEGETYTVTGIFDTIDCYGKSSDIGYCLEGTDQDFAYPKCRFIIVSDIDETEMVRELQLIKLN